MVRISAVVLIVLITGIYTLRVTEPLAYLKT